MTIKKSLQNIVAGIAIGASALCAGGCATTGSYAESSNSNIGYEKFYDSYGDYKLVQKNNDIYLEKLDGSEAPKQITHTPNIDEDSAGFNKNGEYITYRENYGGQYNYEFKFFRIKRNEDDSKRVQISSEEAYSLQTNLNLK